MRETEKGKEKEKEGEGGTNCGLHVHKCREAEGEKSVDFGCCDFIVDVTCREQSNA